MLKELRRLLDDERGGANYVGFIHEEDILGLMAKIEYPTREAALARGVAVVKGVIAAAARMGIDFKTIEPGHSVGHLVRDYVNALRLFSGLEARPADIFVGFVAGVLHDIGCALVDRYDEPKRVMRHAEAAAALLVFLFQQETLGLSPQEQVAITYAVAAHTHYLKPQIVKMRDLTDGLVTPYTDFDPVKNVPIWAVWFPRWVDRLDCSGPTFVARHYLTLVRPHTEFDQHGFHDTGYESAMRRLLRDKPEDSRTMLEHLKGFADSQTNESAYGQYDLPWMQELRASQRKRLYRIIEAAGVKDGVYCVSPGDVHKVCLAWVQFLVHNVEPCRETMNVATKLDAFFEEMNATDQRWWATAFLITMKEYEEWAETTLTFLRTLPPDWLCLPGLVDSVQSVIEPNPSWRDSGVLGLLS